MDGRQMDMLDDVDRYEKAAYDRRLAEIREKLRTEYEPMREKFGIFVDKLPDGLVAITECTRYLNNRNEVHYYRVVVGHHGTVSGPMTHLISAPDDEWPDVPVWQYDDRNKCQWIYPHGAIWVRKEPEYQPDVKWA